MKKKVVAFALAAVLLSCALYGCGGKHKSGSAADDTPTLHLAMAADIVSMDAHMTTENYIVPMNVFDSLFSMEKQADGTISIEKNLVDTYEISEDGLVYKFKLKDGIVFSDGTPLTAEDVKFTFERILTLPQSVQTDFVIAIAGATELLNGDTTELSGLKVEDDTHFNITLVEPFSGFLSQLAAPSTVIYSKKLVTEAGENFGSDPGTMIGTGPYVINEWNRNKNLIFTCNPKYWGKEPSAKRVEISIMEPEVMSMAFQKGDLDIIDCNDLDAAVVEAAYKTDAYKDHLVMVDRLGLNYFMLNEKIKPLDNIKVRRAIQMAIDRQSILDSIYNGDGRTEDGAYPKGCFGYTEANRGWLSYDPKGAKKLLAEAGYADGFDMDITVDANSNEVERSTVEVITQNLSDIGIRANMQTMDHASYLDKRNSGNVTAYLALWLLDINDPDNILYTFFGSRANTVLRSNNYYDDATIERITAARSIVDEEERIAEYQALEKKLVQEDAVWVPMFSLKRIFVTGDRIKSFTPHWAGWSDIPFADVELK